MVVKYEPTRMCIACRKRFSKNELSRYVVQKTFDNNLQLETRIEDTYKKLEGRGYYLCNDPLCKEKFQKIRMKKNTKTKQEKSKKV